MNDRVADIYDRVGKTQNIVIQKTEDSAKNHEELMEGLGEAFSIMGKTLLEIKQKDTTPDKPIPQSFILPHSPISIVSPVYKPEEKSNEKKFPIHFPKEKPNPSSSSTNPNLSLVSIQRPSYENIPHHMNRPPAPDLLGKGKMPEAQTFAEDWFPEWNIDGLSVGQVRQLLERMYVSYKIMCMKGKSETKACKSLIQFYWKVVISRGFI
jgi:hypothetical protein